MYLVAAALAGVVALLAPAVPAQADDSTDNGDGSVVCNNGEICFQWGWDNFDTSIWQRHFWWGDSDHSDNYWHNIPNPSNPALSIKDSISGVWNRDTECGIWLQDLAVAGYLYKYAILPRGARGNYGADRNNAHGRC
jgi:hypothetical protein